MTSSISSSLWHAPGPKRRALISFAFLLLCLALLARYQLLTHFTLLPGDRFDVVISTTILEHWFNVFTGHDRWSEVGYFYPYTRTIAQTDAYFLAGVVYFPFRAYGLDPFLAAEYATLTLRALGFGTMFLLCRRVFALPFYWALLAAGLFILSNGMIAHSSRLQLTALVFAPLMAWLLWHAIRGIEQNQPATFRRAGIAAALLYGAWCMTCFYIAWFFAFFFTVFAVVLLIRATGEERRTFGRHLMAQKFSVLAVLGTTVLAMLPFAFAFIPKSREVGVRAYESVLGNTVPLEDILQVGPDNLLFGKLYNSALKVLSPSYVPMGEYANTGFACMLFFLFVCGCLQLLRQARRKQPVLVLSSVVIATLLTWAATLKINGHSAWFVVYHLFPGASALNVVSAYQLFLAFPVVIVAVRFLSTQRVTVPIGILLAGLLITEELNRPYLNFDRPAELARIALPHPAPPACKSFYVTGWPADDANGGFPAPTYNAYAHNVSAMMIAQLTHLPTLNGVASFSPKDWNFALPLRADYEDRLFTYARKHGIGNLCKFDLVRKTWQPISAAAIARSVDTDHLYFTNTAWPGLLVSDHGLSFQEAWGVWSKDTVVSFDFSQPLPVRFTLRLRAHAFGPNVGKTFTAQLGSQHFPFVLTGETADYVLPLTNPDGARTLAIRVPAAVSPQELGMGNDGRKLGLGLVDLRIVPAN